MAINVDKIKPFLLPALFILASLFFVLFFIYPALENIMVVRGEMAPLEERRVLLANKVQILENVNEFELKKDLAAAEVSLPTDKNAAGMINGLEIIAATSGAKLTTFSTVVGKMATDSAKTEIDIPAAEVLFPGGVKNIPVDATLTGDLNAIKEFINKLNGVNRLIGVDRVDIDNITGKFILMVFYQPLAATLGDVTSPVEDISLEDRNFLRQAVQYSLATPELPNLPAGKANPFQ